MRRTAHLVLDSYLGGSCVLQKVKDMDRLFLLFGFVVPLASNLLIRKSLLLVLALFLLAGRADVLKLVNVRYLSLHLVRTNKNLHNLFQCT